MAILNREKPVEGNSQEFLTNLDMMNILEEVASSRLQVISQTFGADSEKTKSILDLFTTSMFVIDPHLSLADEEIKRIWENMFERSRDARQFLLSVHSHFVTIVTETNYQKLIVEKAKSLFAFKPDTFFNENNVVLDNEEDFITYLKLYPWFSTYLLLGDVLASSAGLTHGAS